jgi:SAM-dependent methyltransferase
LLEYQTLFDARGTQYSRANLRWPEARAEEASAILRHLALRGGARWLDVQAGGGYLSDRARALGLPAASASCDASLPFLLSAGGASRSCVCEPEGLPFREGAFDAVGCLAALHHAADPAALCRELLRVTAPGGRAALGDAARDSRAAAYLNGFVDRHTPAGHRGRFYSPEELEGFVVLAGGKDPKVESVEISWILPSARDAVLFFRSLFGLEATATDREIEAELDGLGAAATPAGFRIPWTMHYASAARF